MRQVHPGKRGIVALFAASLLILSAFSARSTLATTTMDQSNDAGSSPSADTFGYNDYAQTFTPTISGSLVEFDMYMDGIASQTVKLESTSGGLPTGTILATSSPVTLASETWYAFSFTSPYYNVVAGTTYAIVFNLGTYNVVWGDINGPDSIKEQALVETTPTSGSWTFPKNVVPPPGGNSMGEFAFEEFVTAAPTPTPTLTPTPTPTPTAPSSPDTSVCGQVGFTGVPDGWYLTIEPGDILVTSGFDSIALVPATYTYEWRDAGANDQTGGTFTVEACSTPTPTSTPTATPMPIPTAIPTPTCGLIEDIQPLVEVVNPCPTPTATSTATSTATNSRAPSPSAMPDTSTGGNSSDDGALPLVLFGLLLLGGGFSYAVIRRLRFLNRPS